MREGIFRIMFVGSNSKACQDWKQRLEAITTKSDVIKRIEVLTATDGGGVHQCLMKIHSMPHLFLVEFRGEGEEITIVRNLKEMLPLSTFGLVIDRLIDKRIFQSLVINARQSGVDNFLAEDAPDEEISELFRLIVDEFKYSLKALSPIKHLMQKTE